MSEHKLHTVIFVATYTDPADRDAIADALSDAAIDGGDLEVASASWVTHDEDDYVDVTHTISHYEDA